MKLQVVPVKKQAQCWGSLRLVWDEYPMHKEQSPVCDIWQDDDWSDPDVFLPSVEKEYTPGFVVVWLHLHHFQL
jgi:hypothetical protein